MEKTIQEITEELFEKIGIIATVSVEKEEDLYKVAISTEENALRKFWKLVFKKVWEGSNLGREELSICIFQPIQVLQQNLLAKDAIENCLYLKSENPRAGNLLPAHLFHPYSIRQTFLARFRICKRYPRWLLVTHPIFHWCSIVRSIWYSGF